jgi:hypothetical protein
MILKRNARAGQRHQKTSSAGNLAGDGEEEAL